MSEVDKIAGNIRRLSDWYKANKPAINYVSINAKDAAKIRELWKNEDKRPDVAMAGFKIHADGHMTWSSWQLKEAGGAP
jgi:hypothetical protein